jgi:hypothetical protein
MTQMLEKNQTKRLYKLDEISSHNWFRDFSFDDLISLNMKPPYIPKVDNKETRCRPKPYLDYIKNLPEWQPEEGEELRNPSRKEIADFEKWHANF